ncbi:MAG: addiction module protein [Gammaproteobacteria bacterium]|jgi:putative addiction module component (TIGR02574 family)|nr:addiction module protein [Gammaproteobacteria bacterium]
MARKAEELYNEALALSPEEREELVRLLTMQTDSKWASPEIEQAWLDECDRRYQEWQDGDVDAIPADEATRQIRDQLQK